MARKVKFDQPSAAPSAKVSAVAVIGALATIATAIASGQLDGPTLYVAGTTLVSFVTAYFKRDMVEVK